MARASSIYDWPPFVHALSGSATYGECLFRICEAARVFSTSIEYRVESDGVLATFSTHRTFNPANPPRQVDAFGIGHHLQIFTTALVGSVDLEEMTVSVCDPAVLPREMLRGAAVNRKDKRGARFTFPASWLTRKTRRLPGKPDLAPLPTPEAQQLPDLAEITRHMLQSRLHDGDFTIETAAKFLGLNRRAYQLALRDLSTTYGAIQETVRKEAALNKLRFSNEPLDLIAAQLGYRSASNFSRAFRNWTGQSPSQFRAKQC